jgi:hypothetical protein
MSVKILNVNILFFIFSQLILVMFFYFLQPYPFEIFILIFEKHLEIFLHILLIYIFLSIIKRKNFLVLMVILSLLFKYLYGFYHYYLFNYFQGYPMSMGNSYDEHTYYIFAKDFSKLVWSYSIIDFSFIEKFPLNYMGYPYIMAFIYNIFGCSNWYHIIINPIFITLSGVIFYKLLKESTNLNISIIRIWLILFLFLPSFNYFSVLNLKDSLLFFILAISLYSSWKIFKSKEIFRLFNAFLLGISTYFLYFIRAEFIILPILFLFFLVLNLKKINIEKIKLLFYIVLAGLIVLFYFNIFYTKVMNFFRWDFLMLVFSKIKKWTIIKKYPFLIPFTLLLSPFMILLPLPILYPLPPSINTNISSEIFKIPINLEYIFISLLLLFLILNKKIKKLFITEIVNLPYFKMLILVFIMLVISNYLTYERHRLILMLFLYLPTAYVIYQIYFKKIYIKSIKYTFYILIIIDILTIYWTYLRGILKEVF